ncbi:MAG: hypothetical protein KIG31_07940, partial [Oscillospiraceae bacterium]|nr:hypothetical protein [Oscillospiraceae bacterium]
QTGCQKYLPLKIRQLFQTKTAQNISKSTLLGTYIPYSARQSKTLGGARSIRVSYGGVSNCPVILTHYYRLVNHLLCGVPALRLWIIGKQCVQPLDFDRAKDDN